MDHQLSLVRRQFRLAVLQVEAELLVEEAIAGGWLEERLSPEECLAALRADEQQQEQRR